MAITYERLKALQIPVVRESYGPQQAILYALGIGLGQEPTDARQLAYLYERELKVLPMMANVIGHPGFWLRDLPTGVDAMQVVHGQQKLVLHKPLPSKANIVSTTKIIDIVDKGPGRGAIITTEREIRLANDDSLLATLEHVSFCRGDGGFGGPPGNSSPARAVPDRPADQSCSLQSRPETALLYRLSGDFNPLHADPEVAARAGFARPILHGLASFGMAGHAVLRTYCDYAAERLKSIEARFSAVVYPGEQIDFDFWDTEGGVSFRGRVEARGVVVLNNGFAALQ
jgi:acyl dehydratase